MPRSSKKTGQPVKPKEYTDHEISVIAYRKLSAEVREAISEAEKTSHPELSKLKDLQTFAATGLHRALVQRKLEKAMHSATELGINVKLFSSTSTGEPHD